MNYSIKYFAVSPEIDTAFDRKALSLNGKKINSRTYVFNDIIRASDFADLGHEIYIGMGRIAQRIVDGEEYDVTCHWGSPIEQDFNAARRAKSNDFLREMLKKADNDLHEADVIDHDCLFYPLNKPIAAEQPKEMTTKPKETKKRKSFWRNLF